MKNERIYSNKKIKGTQSKTHSPTIGLGLPLGEFVFYESTMNLLNIDKEKEGLMFYVSQKDKKIRIEIEEKADDNYHLAGSKRSYSRFTSKPLGAMFSDMLDLQMDKKHFFTLTKLKKGVFEMTLIDKQ